MPKKELILRPLEYNKQLVESEIFKTPIKGSEFRNDDTDYVLTEDDQEKIKQNAYQYYQDDVYPYLDKQKKYTTIDHLKQVPIEFEDNDSDYSPRGYTYGHSLSRALNLPIVINSYMPRENYIDPSGVLVHEFAHNQLSRLNKQHRKLLRKTYRPILSNERRTTNLLIRYGISRDTGLSGEELNNYILNMSNDELWKYIQDSPYSSLYSKFDYKLMKDNSKYNLIRDALIQIR